jgi:hypothetical protein
MGQTLLATYLNDHLAGATAGRALAKRILSENEGNELGAFFAWLLPEIDSDLDELRRVMQRVGAAEDPIKRLAALAAERLGRLKLNGRILGYSPLSPLVECEAMALGIHGKHAMWIALREIDDPRLAGMDFDHLAARAREQLDRLEEHRLRVARTALTTPR